MTVSALVGALVAVLVGCGADEGPGGLTTDELQARWWSWAVAQPAGADPVSDRTGTNCAVGQGTDVWLLAHAEGFADRTCEVPAGISIAGPVMTTWGAERIDCSLFMDLAEATVTLNGETRRFSALGATPTQLDVTPGNELIGAEGPVDVYTCGYWYAFDPLPEGEHVLRLNGSPGTGSWSNVTYRLTVTANASG